MDILDNKIFDEQSQQYFEASKGKRITNYFIDYTANSIFIFLIWLVITMILIAFMGEDDALLIVEGESLPSFLLQVIVSSIISIVFYALIEYYSNGKSLGKLITKTRAVRRSGENLTFEIAIKRSACRLIPFDAFSYLGNVRDGWHDSIPKTKVIDENLPIHFPAQLSRSTSEENLLESSRPE